jgi:hypothetical protein
MVIGHVFMYHAMRTGFYITKMLSNIFILILTIQKIILIHEGQMQYRDRRFHQLQCTDVFTNYSAGANSGLFQRGRELSTLKRGVHYNFWLYWRAAPLSKCITLNILANFPSWNGMGDTLKPPLLGYANAMNMNFYIILCF